MVLSTLRALAGPALLDQLESALAHTWSLRPQVPDAIRGQVSLALAEILANIAEHGNADDDHPIHVEVEIYIGVGQLLITVTDDGEEPQIDLATVSMPNWDAESGRGLAIAKAVLDSLTYHRAAGFNHWRLTSKPF